MNRPVTRHELAAALVRVLHSRGIANAQRAIEVLGPPHHTVHLFGIILSEPAKPVLTEQLKRATGRFHASAGDVWILSEDESAALIHALQGNNITSEH
jgi:hypothetical protein